MAMLVDHRVPSGVIKYGWKIPKLWLEVSIARQILDFYGPFSSKAAAIRAGRRCNGPPVWGPEVFDSAGGSYCGFGPSFGYVGVWWLEMGG